MKFYSDNEKKIINKILDLASKHQTNCASNVFFDIKDSLYGLNPGFNYVFQNRMIEIIYDTKKYNTSSKLNFFHFETLSILTEFSLLIDFLIENDYLALCTTENCEYPIPENYMSIGVMDHNLKVKITKYFSCLFIPTSKLRLLQKYKFQDLESFFARKQLKITNILALSSLIISLFSVFISIINIFTTQDIKITNEVLEVSAYSNQHVEVIHDLNIEETPLIFEISDATKNEEIFDTFNEIEYNDIEEVTNLNELSQNSSFEK